jgi:hypothetical protein
MEKSQCVLSVYLGSIVVRKVGECYVFLSKKSTESDREISSQLTAIFLHDVGKRELIRLD